MYTEERIIGIDLGTTNSVVAICIGSEPEVITNQEGQNKTPSVVAFLENGEVIVGEIARRQAATNPRRTVASVKRLMGRSLEEIEESGELFPYQLVEHDGELLIDIDGMGYRPEQVSALVLKRLKESAESYLGEEVTKAVITVPAYFDDLQRQATIDSAQMAGLEVLRLINEPTAAAMAYGLGCSPDNEEIVAVYDFGGGTFDVTILEISGKTFEVLTSTGDSRLGGDDLDQTLVGLIVDEFYEQHGVDLAGDPVTLRRLKEVAERAKCELSTTTHTNISLPFIAYKDGQALHLDRPIARTEFEDLIEDFVRRTIKCCKRALEEANLQKKDIHRVILVGGTTRIPMIQEAVEEFFDKDPFKGVNPDEVVALGAATQAGVFEGTVQEVILLDVTPHSLGIEVEGGKFSHIIEKNSTIPIKAAKTFTTTEENQEFVNIHVLQGDSHESAEARSLGKFMLTGIPPGSAGSPRIRVTFFINADGVVEISAEEMGSGQSQAMTIVHSQLSQEEKDRRARRRKRQTRSGKAKPAASPRGRRGSGSSGPRGGSASPGRPPEEVVENPALSPRATPPRTPAVPSATPKPVSASASDTGSHQEFAVLGDANPSAEPVAGGVRAREMSHRGLAPVDYSKVPPMYSHMEPPRRQAGSTVVAGQSPKSEPPGKLPKAPVEASPAPAAEAAPERAKVRALEPTVPPLLAEAISLAEARRDDHDSQVLYSKGLEILRHEPFASSMSYTILRARVLLNSMAGMLEEARAALTLLRENLIHDASEEIIALHDTVMERFGAASVLRDRGRAREAVGDLAGACADFEQAARQDAQGTDRDELERLYRLRIEKTPDDPHCMFKLVKLLLKRNAVDEAIEVLQRLKEFTDFRDRAVKVLGLCHWQKNMFYLAWDSFKTLPLDDDLKDILYRLAGEMEAADQLNHAMEVLEYLNANAQDYRDTDARLRKVSYRLKLQSEEQAPANMPAMGRNSRFTILEEINRGSMGIIYKAKDKTLNEIVALKVLNDYLSSDPSAVERFTAEARAARKLAHPYIVRIHDLMEIESRRYISMEYIEGRDLKHMISEKTTFTEEQVIYYFLQICDALSYAHKLGVVHRDIKPANIMITSRNTVKIADFGIAKILQDDATKSGTAVIGTPLYMAPEQILGEPVDGRSDIYALGIMMYEMVSGNPPFYLGNIEYHHIHTMPPPLPERVSPKMRDIVMKMIQKKPEDRFQSVDEIVMAVRSV